MRALTALLHSHHPLLSAARVLLMVIVPLAVLTPQFVGLADPRHRVLPAPEVLAELEQYRHDLGLGAVPVTWYAPHGEGLATFQDLVRGSGTAVAYVPTPMPWSPERPHVVIGVEAGGLDLRVVAHELMHVLQGRAGVAASERYADCGADLLTARVEHVCTTREYLEAAVVVRSGIAGEPALIQVGGVDDTYADWRELAQPATADRALAHARSIAGLEVES